jgi:hypothetical protein
MEATATCMRGVLPSRIYTAVFSVSKCNHGTTIQEIASGIEHTGGLWLSFKEA